MAIHPHGLQTLRPSKPRVPNSHEQRPTALRQLEKTSKGVQPWTTHPNTDITDTDSTPNKALSFPTQALCSPTQTQSPNTVFILQNRLSSEHSLHPPNKAIPKSPSSQYRLHYPLHRTHYPKRDSTSQHKLHPPTQALSSQDTLHNPNVGSIISTQDSSLQEGSVP